MKNFDYYEGKDLTFKAFNRSDYTKYYFYKKGKVLSPEKVADILKVRLPHNLGEYNPSFAEALKKEGILMEKDFDQASFDRDFEESRRPFWQRRGEFKGDLFEDNGYSLGDPKAELIYSKVTEDHSSFYEIKYAFEGLDEFAEKLEKLYAAKKELKQ